MNILKTNIGTSPKLYVCFPTFYVLLLFLTLVCLIKSYMETSGRDYVYALWSLHSSPMLENTGEVQRNDSGHAFSKGRGPANYSPSASQVRTQKRES